MNHFIVVELHQEVYEDPTLFSLDVYYKEGIDRESVLKEVRESLGWSDYFTDVRVFQVDRKPSPVDVRWYD